MGLMDRIKKWLKADEETHSGLESAAPMQVVQVEGDVKAGEEKRAGLESAAPMPVVQAEDLDQAQGATEKKATPPSGSDTPAS